MDKFFILFVRDYHLFDNNVLQRTEMTKSDHGNHINGF